MRWKPWLLALLSAVALACATAAEPPLTATVIVGGPKSKRALELKGREYTLTLTALGLDKKMVVRTATGKLDKDEYRRLTERLDGVDFGSFKPLYTSPDLDRTGASISLRVSHRGRQVTLTVIGQPPAAVAPLLEPFLPLLDRPI